ncbi:DUF5615 family PIN-like protein [Myxosarcina sp. GI1]|uniref:DUF5615 family PIN-like protein n=1 Tax=Myxosarcina sp. GI1 TaxID=1541065 RepID=UPI00055ED784|nr:DUF5615 family PIN-like protein [Myxosarcina sp. GI1]
MKVRFLLDENLSPRLKLAIFRFNPQIDILRVGDSSTPSFGTSDPDILVYLEQSQRILLTDNRASMPQHLEAHWNCNRSIWGLFWLRPQANIREIAEDLNLIWETTEAEEWKNQLAWIPL